MTRNQTLSGGGALELGDHRLLEDGSERGGALVSDVVAFETASEGWGGDGERPGVSLGADKEREHSRVVAHLSVVIFVSLRAAASAEVPWALIKLDPRLRARGG